MNLGDIRQELFDHGFQDETPTRIDAAINDSYYDVCSRLPYAFLDKQTNINTVGGVDTLTMPTDFRAVISLTVPTLSAALQPVRLDDFQKRYAGQELQSGQPVYYYFIGYVMHLWPIPDTVYAIRMNYVSTPVALANTTDIPVIPVQHHRVITLGALVTLYNMEDDPDLAAVFNQQFERRMATMLEDVSKRQYDRPDRIYDIYGNDDYFIW